MSVNIKGKNGKTIAFKDHIFIACATEILNDVSHIMFLSDNNDYDDNNNSFIENLKKYTIQDVAMFCTENKVYISFTGIDAYYVFANLDEDVIKKIHENHKVLLSILKKVGSKVENEGYIIYDNVIAL